RPSFPTRRSSDLAVKTIVEGRLYFLCTVGGTSTTSGEHKGGHCNNYHRYLLHHAVETTTEVRHEFRADSIRPLARYPGGRVGGRQSSSSSRSSAASPSPSTSTS